MAEETKKVYVEEYDYKKWYQEACAKMASREKDVEALNAQMGELRKTIEEKDKEIKNLAHTLEFNQRAADRLQGKVDAYEFAITFFGTGDCS